MICLNLIFVKLTHKVHGQRAGHINPLPRRHEFHTVLVFVCVIGFSFPPLGKGAHRWALHINKLSLTLQVINADVHSAKAGICYVASDGPVCTSVFGHSQVATPALAVEFSISVTLLLLHQQVHFTVRLFNASDSCRGGQCWKVSTGISLITLQHTVYTEMHCTKK